MDYREELLKKFEMMIIGKFSDEDIYTISNCFLRAIDEYEIVARCTDIVPHDGTNEYLLKEYAASLLVEHKSKGTIKAYITELRHFSDFIGGSFLEAKAIDLRRYIAFHMSNGVSDRTCENIRSYINAFYEWAAREEHAEKNPMSKVKPIKFSSEREDPFSDIDITKMRDAIEDLRLRALFEVLLSSGLRVAELCNLEVSDINWQTLAVHVRHGKGNKERITYINPIAKLYLQKYLDSRKTNNNLVFCNERGGGQMKPRNVGLHLSKIGERAGVPNVHPHRFRHTFASKLAKAGMPAQEIQLLLGHSNLNTTMIYVSVESDMIRNSYMRYSA